jgi:phospholipase C
MAKKRYSVPKCSAVALGLALALAAPAAASPDCSRAAGSLPRPGDAPGTRDPSNPIEHVLVFMQENRSFDTWLGRLSEEYGGEIDGVEPWMWNPDPAGNRVYVFHQPVSCIRDPDHSWDASHADWNEGAMDHFVLSNEGKRGDGRRVMGYYDETDLPMHYAIARRFAVADRYFSSVMGPTYPNRFFLMAGTSFGHIRNDLPPSLHQYAQRTIFDQLDRYGIDWKYYYTDLPANILFLPEHHRDRRHLHHVSELFKDLRTGHLPSVAFVESSLVYGTEYPSMDFHLAQVKLAKRLRAVMSSPAWPRTALFLTYDEAGGLFDHVSPPEACVPDATPPKLESGDAPGAFNHYGFRVPLLVLSPYARRHFVSHVVHDHTSILKFIETKFNLPALTARDANADALLDLFDFTRPDLEVPELPEPRFELGKFLSCIGKVIPSPLQ